ncbi:unnamed protein product [Dracunculus medinensis]|uniref:Bardet-Biedl syndrome 2 protein homolog n=1 Tax=Dracunculus medinensis TaxID=318479 RepID=A0A158Q6M4_DRAME|nr:unnamed protein product [Dracunculus medinensis]
MILKALDSFDVSHQIIAKCAHSGIIDESAKSQFIFATTTNKIMVHESDTSLNINDRIQALVIAPLDTSYDVIIVGTTSCILAYDFQRNSSLFQRDIVDGINCIKVGSFSLYDSIIMCGGNCAIWGLDKGGNDLFWTVTGDNVLSLCFCDVDNDGINELIVGSEDFDIRIFKSDLLLYELNETDAVIYLQDLKHERFAYALANGTIGVYKEETRLWRIKSKNQCMAFTVFPDSESLVCAWVFGKIDIRNVENGDITAKESFKGKVANIYTVNNKLVVAMQDGNVRTFEMADSEIGVIADQTILHELGLKKNSLLIELSNYEQCHNDQNDLESKETTVEIEKRIPANTHLETYLTVNWDLVPPSVELQISLSNEAIVRAVIIFAEGIFGGESFTVTQLHIFELTRTLPRFAMFAVCVEDAPEPEGIAEFIINEKPIRLASWINENFLLHDEITSDPDSALAVKFYSLRTKELLFITMDCSGKVVIRNNDMELVGNVVQSIAEYFSLEALSTKANFPFEMKNILEICEKFREAQLIRDRLNADVAEKTGFIKEMIVRAEDARIIGQKGMMKRYYIRLNMLEEEVISGHRIRCNNYNELLKTLRDLNKFIEKAARLRAGAPASRVVAALRNAIAHENFDMMHKIIFYGV